MPQSKKEYRMFAKDVIIIPIHEAAQLWRALPSEAVVELLSGGFQKFPGAADAYHALHDAARAEAGED